MDDLKQWGRYLLALPFLLTSIPIMGVALAIAAATACLCAALVIAGLILFTVGRSISTRRVPSLREWIDDAMGRA